MKNKYAKRSRSSEDTTREIVRDVAADLTALPAAARSGLNRNTVHRLYRGVRERMLLACEAQRRLEDNRGVIGSNGKLHDRRIDTVRQVSGGPARGRAH